MSQNFLTMQGPKGPLSLIIGWDRPLQGFFCNVIAEDEDDTDFSNLSFRTFPTLDELRQELANLGIGPIPMSVVEAVQSDADTNAGNIVRRFDADGTQAD